VRVEIIARDEISGIEGYSFDGGLTWQEENSKEYTDNVEEIIMQVKDKAGNIVEATTSIGNITHEKPRYEVIFKNYDGTVLQTEQVEEGILPEYKGQTPIKEKEGYICTFVGWDKEIKEVTENAEYIATYTEEEIKYVAKIKETGKSYASLENALQEQQEGQTIILIDNVEEKVEIVENKKVVLDLNGKTIVNPSEEQITIINKGELTIVDNSEGKNGEIKNTINKAIVNEANAILNMGNKENEVSKGPYIEGETIGIENKGTFNFYDGTIRGIKAIEGTINEKAEGYNVLIGKTEDEVKQEAVLGTIGEAVARIDNNYYVSLESAVNALVKENEELEENQTTITMINDTLTTNPINIEKYMNIKLDLNGKIVSSNATGEYMIKNDGKLEITDSSEENIGEITTTSNNILVDNQDGAVLKIAGGKLSSYKTYCIYNKGTGAIEITGGTVINTNNSYGYNYCIYNEDEGTVNITGGEITGENGYSSYGIYTISTKTIEVTGGTITGDSYGIYVGAASHKLGETPKKAGTANINGGTINGGISNGSGTININEGTIITTNAIAVSNGSGIVNINGGTITNNSGYKSNSQKGISNSSGTININEGTITSTYGSGISNSSGTININGGTVESYYTGIDNKGTINITRGTITSNGASNHSNYGIYNSEEGTITLGTNDKIVYPSTYPNENTEEIYPIIKGTQNGIYNEGTFNYYDGIIFANETSRNAIYGAVEKIEEGYNIILKDIEENEEHYVILGQEPICRILDTNGNVVVDESGKEVTYSNLKDAFANCSNEYTIQIIKTVNNAERIEIPVGKKLKIDLNGNQVISLNKEGLINNFGNLEILDSSEKKTGQIKSVISKAILENNGTLKISSGIFLNENEGIKKQYNYVINNNSGELIIQGGTISITKSYMYAIYNNGTIKMAGGTIRSRDNNSYGIYNDGVGTIEMTGGIIDADTSWGYSYGIYNNSQGIVKISGGTIQGFNTIYNYSSSKIEISGGNISRILNAGLGIIEISGGNIAEIYNNSEGTVNITGGTISSSRTAIYNYDKGTINITGGTVSSTDSYSDTIENRGKINITGGTVKSSGSNGYAITNYKELNITGGEVSATAYNSYGIYNYQQGTVTLGIDDKVVYPTIYPNVNTEETYPTVKGIKNGIYNLGTLKYYDGIISVNSTSANTIYGSVNDTAKIYNENDEIIGMYDVSYKDIEKNEEQGIKAAHYAILGKDPMCRVLDSQGSVLLDSEGSPILYYNFEKAISDCQEGYTIQIIRTVNCNDKIEIPVEKKLKLDLNGNKISLSNSECLIINNGNLEILDSATGTAGSIFSTLSSNIIENNGTLKISRGTISNDASGTSEKYNSAIKNNSGNLIVAGGIITTNGNYSYSICNNSQFEMTGGTISGNDVVNIGSGTINISGGTISTGVNNHGVGTIKMTDGTISSYDGVYNYGAGTIRITGGSISLCDGVCNYGEGKIIVEGGNIRANVTAGSSGITVYGISNLGTGTIEITGGTIRASVNSGYHNTYAYGLHNEKGTVKISGGNIIGQSATIISCGIFNGGTLEITGGEITGYTNGISNSGTANITGGTITSYDYGIYNLEEGKITLGTNDKIVYPSAYPSENTEEIYPIIKGNEKGIYNKGTFNYYDGIIFASGTSVNAISGLISDKADIYNENNEVIGEFDIIYRDIESEHYVILGQEVACKILDTNNQAITDENGKEVTYNNLVESFEKCPEEYTIQIIRTVNNSEKIEIPQDKKLKVDFNGNKIIVSNKEGLINNYGDLEILDSSEGQDGQIINEVSTTILENNGTLKISSGAILNNASGTSQGYNSTIKNNSGSLNITGGTITANGDYIYSIYNNAKLDISGGTVSGEIINIGSQTINISGETASLEKVTNDDSGTINISNGTISEGVYNNKAGIINVTGGTINGGISNQIGTVKISDGIISGISNGISNGGTLEINGGTISLNQVSNNSEGIMRITGGIIKGGISNLGTLTITGGTVTKDWTAVSNRGTLNITGGTIKSTSSYTISNYGGGTINIGNNDGEVLENVPEIKSNSSYGIYNSSGTINFYDGAIIGKGTAVYGTITGLPEGYGIKSEIKTIELIEGLQVFTLQRTGTSTSEASVNGIYYNSLQEAIDACTNTGDVITLQRNVSIDKVTIPAEKTITIDLNGFTIAGTIENNGTLSITNNKGTVTEGSYGTITGSGTTNV
ncbi:MAG: hypothetical protein IJE59_01935, partial [Clostridia bacterium]|nr:hypothetical protein [Clostridia bacterium]